MRQSLRLRSTQAMIKAEKLLQFISKLYTFEVGGLVGAADAHRNDVRDLRGHVWRPSRW